MALILGAVLTVRGAFFQHQQYQQQQQHQQHQQQQQQQSSTLIGWRSLIKHCFALKFARFFCHVEGRTHAAKLSVIGCVHACAP